MYVYYDINGDIKAITPNLDENLLSGCSSATFPVDDVAGFLTAQKNPFEYMVKEVKRATSTTYKIVRKESKVVYTRTLDNYLTKVEADSKAILLITNHVADKTISITVNEGFKLLRTEGTDEEIEEVDNFTNRASITLYFTKRNDPYHWLHTMTFSPKEAMEKDKIYINYDLDLSDTSVYTKKVFGSYGYKIERK
jgi:spore germination protein GerM